MKNTAEWYCCMGSVIEIYRESRQDLMPLNFPFEYIHLIVQLSVLFNACIKLRIIIDIFPCIVLQLQACGYLLGMFEDMPLLILKVVSGILARLVPIQNRRYEIYYIRTVHILFVQSWRRS
ncbi:UNVERIFIED_CONTAM: hypothetical protein NCL1_47431 [Trichonephila clavipes]